MPSIFGLMALAPEAITNLSYSNFKGLFDFKSRASTVFSLGLTFVTSCSVNTLTPVNSEKPSGVLTINSLPFSITLPT